jgi:hypothetical protein
MQHLFFNATGPFHDVARTVSEALNLPLPRGDSDNALGGEYYAASILGILLRLEQNSFEHETEYEYMLSVREDLTSSLRVSSSVSAHVAWAVAQMLADNAGFAVARQDATGLETVRPGQPSEPVRP